MTIEEIRSYRNAQPFIPFDILRSDGPPLQVEFPERIAFSPTGRLVTVFEGSDLSFVNLASVTALQARPRQFQTHPRRA